MGNETKPPVRSQGLRDLETVSRHAFVLRRSLIYMRFRGRGAAGILSEIEIDTANFMGNFPESCEVHATNNVELLPLELDGDGWTLILPRAKLGPHRQHHFQLENVDNPFTHIKVTIYPDGGIKRVRVMGRRAGGISEALSRNAVASQTYFATDELVSNLYEPATAAARSPPSPNEATKEGASGPAIPALPLTAEAFAPFGQVIQAYADVNAVPSPRSTRVTTANQGSAHKFHKLALLASSYPPSTGATSGISVYRCKPIELESDDHWHVKLLERHPYTNQAFIPMGGSPIAAPDSIADPGTRYLVIVALNDDDGMPNLKTMRAFIASAGQGIVYSTGTWRECRLFARCPAYPYPENPYVFCIDHPMAALDKVWVLVMQCPNAAADLRNFRGTGYGFCVCGNSNWGWKLLGL